MPVLPGHISVSRNAVEKRDWNETVGQSGMTPTAFAFLIPIFVVVILCPLLAIYCIRRRRNAGRGVGGVIPLARPAKKPALRRAEARERLNNVTEVSNVTGTVGDAGGVDAVEGKEQVSSSASILERECAICLSTLHAPSPPEPALIASTSTSPTDAAAIKSPSIKDAMTTTTTPEDILKLRVCGHEFHAECLVSWVVLRKTTCPICRATYISKEEMQQLDEEAAVNTMTQMEVVEPTATTVEGGAGGVGSGRRVSNWRNLWRGESIRNRDAANHEAARGQVGAREGWMASRWNTGVNGRMPWPRR